MNLDPMLLDIVVCPNCRKSLSVDEAAGELVCSTAAAAATPTRCATTSRSC